jgi:hypothetical protein
MVEDSIPREQVKVRVSRKRRWRPITGPTAETDVARLGSNINAPLDWTGF